MCSADPGTDARRAPWRSALEHHRAPRWCWPSPVRYLGAVTERATVDVRRRALEWCNSYIFCVKILGYIMFPGGAHAARRATVGRRSDASDLGGRLRIWARGFGAGRRVRGNVALASPRLKICAGRRAGRPASDGVCMNAYYEPQTVQRAARLRPQIAILGTYGQFAPADSALRSACRSLAEV